MSRRKDVDWNLPDGSTSIDYAAIAVLMDIRDELKSLNKVIHCPNFLDIPTKLDTIAIELATIRINATKRRRRKPRKTNR